MLVRKTEREREYILKSMKQITSRILLKHKEHKAKAACVSDLIVGLTSRNHLKLWNSQPCYKANK